MYSSPFGGGLSALSRMSGAPITPEVAKPFLDIEREKNNINTARSVAAPLGYVGMHVPLLPASLAPGAAAPGSSLVSPSGAILEHLGLNAPTGALSLSQHLPALMLTGGLGAMGSIIASVGVGKFLQALQRRKYRRQQAQALAGFRQ